MIQRFVVRASCEDKNDSADVQIDAVAHPLNCEDISTSL